MLNLTVKKIVDTMMTTKETTMTEHEGVDIDLIIIQEEYIENKPSVNWMHMGFINHMDT